MPDEDKRKSWIEHIRDALRSGILTGGEASKLAGQPLLRRNSALHCKCPKPCPGRLGFTSQWIFKKLGRALLVPIYKQKTRRDSSINRELQLALEWWLEALQEAMCEV